MATTIDLFTILVQAGVDHLHEGAREISASCPMHEIRTGHPDTSPSWSISRTNYRHICYSCGYKGSLTSLLVDLTGAAPVDLEQALQEQSLLRQWEQVREQPEQIAPALPGISEFALQHNMRDVPEKLLALRKLRRPAIDRYGVRWDPNTKHWILPIRSPAGELLGAQYRRKGYVLTQPEGMSKSHTLFGYSQMASFDQVTLVESPLDAVRLFGLGIPAVSSLGAWVSGDQVRLLARCFTTVFVALDDDPAGQQGAEILNAGLRKYGTAVVPWVYTGLTDDEGVKVKDVGDVADDDSLLASWDRTRRFGF